LREEYIEAIYFLAQENERKKEDKERKELVLRINYLIRLCLLLA